MLFCPQCDSILDINKQTYVISENVTINNDDILKKLIDNEKLSIDEIKNINIDLITKSDFYINLDKKVKNELDKKLKTIISKKGTDEGVMYICKKCGYTKPLIGRTLILSKIGMASSSRITITPQKIRNMLHDKTLPHTRRYICKNTDCISHTQHDKRDAVFFRFTNSLQVYYICCACQTYWTSE